MSIVVDTNEKYPYKFAHNNVTVIRRRLPAGDYAVQLDDRTVAIVERKSQTDVVSSISRNDLEGQMASLVSAGCRAVVVIETTYDRLHQRLHPQAPDPNWIVDAAISLQVRYPSIPMQFAGARAMAEDYTYRYLYTALSEVTAEGVRRRSQEA